MTLSTARDAFDFIDGRFLAPDVPDGQLIVQSPADADLTLATVDTSCAHVERAVESATRALRDWKRLTQHERAAFLRGYQARLRVHQEAIAQTITNEVGKPLWESRTEVAAMIGKVDLSLGPGAQYTETEAIESLPGEIRHRPLGVMAVVGPFNFPGHLPNGQIVPALLLGNTIVHKPSEKTPGAAVWMARCFQEAGLSAGVLNVVQGASDVAQTLTGHAGIDAIAFTGSAAVGARIVQQNAHRYHVPIALELGGKNAALVLEDCDLERTARAITFSAFVTAGQRCTATSRVFVVASIADALIDRIATLSRQLIVGHPLNADVFMGPVINAHAKQALLHAQQLAIGAGFEPVVEGGACEVDGHHGHYLRPSVMRARGGLEVAGYTHAELFGPDLAIEVVRDQDEALTLAERSPWGLAASVYCQAPERFEQVAAGLRAGVIHWNRASTGASGRLPFGGVGRSGNGRPAGILCGRSSSYAQGILRENPDSPDPVWPGFPAAAVTG